MRGCSPRPQRPTANFRTAILDFRRIDHRESPGKFGSSNLTRDNLSREIARTNADGDIDTQTSRVRPGNWNRVERGFNLKLPESPQRFVFSFSFCDQTITTVARCIQSSQWPSTLDTRLTGAHAKIEESNSATT